MDTNSNIPAEKIVVSVEILHLDELGYGPQGKHTRREWRVECFANLTAGVENFETWQENWKNEIDPNLILTNDAFAFKLIYENGSEEICLADFERLSYCYPLDYVGQKFDHSFNPRVFEFFQPTLFAAADFIGTVHFSSAKFFEETSFFAARFHALSYFNNINFKSRVDFSRSIFQKDVIFNKTNFEFKSSFEFCKFQENASFSRVVFAGGAEFSSALFVGAGIFIKANFEDNCFFNNRFNTVTNIWNKNTVFMREAIFENAIFENMGDFQRVRFLTHTPAFRGCKIDKTRLEFSDDSYFPNDECSSDAISNISFLKRLSDEHGQTDQALNFNAMELRSKRKQIEPTRPTYTFKFVTYLYEIVSDYGRSFAKPIFWYGVLICLSALFAMMYSTYSDSPAEEQQVLCKPIKDQPPPLKLPYGRAVVEYAMFRAGGLMDFTDTGKQNNAVNCRLFEEPIEPPLMRAWGIFKGIASIALLFLAALGLRNKYRIK